jgi:uncharacterized protein YxeA
MKKNYWIVILVTVILIAGGFYYYKNFKTITPFCADGQGQSNYVSSKEFKTKLSTIGSSLEDLRTMIDGLNKVAYQTQNCDEFKYYIIQNGSSYKEVSKADLENFVNSKSSELVKVSKDGNSPYFVDNLSANKRLIIVQKDGKYVLIPEEEINFNHFNWGY